MLMQKTRGEVGDPREFSLCCTGMEPHILLYETKASAPGASGEESKGTLPSPDPRQRATTTELEVEVKAICY